MTFSLHQDEEEKVSSYIEAWAKNRYPTKKRKISARVYADKRGKGISLRVTSRGLHGLITRWVEGTRSETKKLRKMPITRAFARGLVDGWIFGDGTKSATGYSGVTSSKQLAWQILQIATDCGRSVSLSVREQMGKGTLPIHQLYIREKFDPRSQKWNRGNSKLRRTGIIRKTSCELEHYEGDVYDLTVEPGHWYIAGGVFAHNSTHQYPDGTFTEVLKRVVEKGYGLHEWCFRENLAPHGWLAPEAVSRKKATVTQSMWDVEYELQEPSPENRAINAQSVQAMFNHELGTFAGELRQYIEIEPPEAAGKYAHGADWARTQDFTIIITFRIDVKPIRIVAFERTQKETWPIMIGKLEKRVARYGGRGAHDATGLGDVVEGFLNSPKIKPIIMRGNERRSLLSEYIAGIENGEIEAPDIEYMKAQHLYATYDKLYGEDHLPDTISAGALGYRASTLPEGVLLG